MKSKERIIIEETGSDEEQARQALLVSGDNLQKAIRIIATDFKNIAVVKCKFICEDISLYGLFSVIVNVRKETIIRQAAIVANNPEIYENDLNLQWHVFEKKLYALRLHEGSLQETTRKFEQDLNWEIKTENRQEFFKLTRDKKADDLMSLLGAIISQSLSNASSRIKLIIEELSLNQFREILDDSTSVMKKKNNETNCSREIVLKTELVQSNGRQNSIEAERLKENDFVMTSIVDSRDIAQYLSRLLGGRKRDTIIPFTVAVEKINYNNNNLIVDVRFGPGIIGRSLVNIKAKIRILRNNTEKTSFSSRIIWVLISVSVLAALIFYILRTVVK